MAITKKYPNLITVHNFAKLRKVTPQNIYSLIKRKKMDAILIDGQLFIETS
jgi:hypothetical protein